MVGAASRDVDFVSAFWIRAKAWPVGGTMNADDKCVMEAADSNAVERRAMFAL
jgi:hypothetical protein